MFIPSLFSIAATEFSKISLVQDLSSVLLVAGIVATLLHFLGWPKVIGYIAAGTVISLKPLSGYFMSDPDSVNVLANLGVIFLMFNLGLELNIRKLRKAGGTVFPAAILDLSLMILAGFVLGSKVFGWGLVPSLFLGAVICDSSTTLLAKSLAEMGCSREKFASIIFGITISEDILTIGVMAVLTGLALTGQFQAVELVRKLGTLGLFLAGVLIFGLLLLPKLLNNLLSKLQDDETLLLIIMGICFGISLIAEKLEFSLALGAFLVGAVISESRVRNRVIEKTAGLRTIFSAVFFVTIGMMVDLTSMWQNKWQILLFVIVVVIGKTLNNFIVALATGQSYRESFQIGVGLAQIGDFAYLVALMGMSLQDGASPYPEMYQMAVGVSIITTLINPFLLRNAGRFADWQLTHLPAPLVRGLVHYTQWTQKTGRAIQSGKQNSAFTRSCIFFVINSMLIAVIFMVGEWITTSTTIGSIFPPFISKHFALFVWLLCCLLCCPLLVNGYLLTRRLAAIVTGSMFHEDGMSVHLWHNSIRNITGVLISTVGLAFIVLEFIILSSLLYFNLLLLIAVVAILCILAWMKWGKLKSIAQNAQETLQNIMSQQDDEPEVSGTATEQLQIIIPDTAGIIGIPLKKLRLRNHVGASVISILHSDNSLNAHPGPDDAIAKGDTITIVCPQDKTKAASAYICGKTITVHDEPLATLSDLRMQKITIPADSATIGKRLSELKFRNVTGAAIVKITRNGTPLSAMPGPDDVLMADDIVSVLGTNEQLLAAKRFLECTSCG